MLKVRGLDAFYWDLQALRDVSLNVGTSEIVALVGANAAGKSTTVNSISGLVKKVNGRIELEGQDITRIPANRRVDLGIVQVPEGRHLFPFMTVLENLELGAFSPRTRPHREKNLKEVFELFPRLKERQNQLAGSLSGGEQQMCAIGRGLMAMPRLMMLDEPTLGLSPILVDTIFEIVKQIRNLGTTILLVEQNVQMSLQVADRAYVLENGRVVMEGQGRELSQNENLRKAYLGI